MKVLSVEINERMFNIEFQLQEDDDNWNFKKYLAKLSTNLELKSIKKITKVKMKKKSSGEANIKKLVRDEFRKDLGLFDFNDSLNVNRNYL